MAKIKLEKQLYAVLKKHWKYYIERIEPKYKGGIPDVLVDVNMKSMFIELKVGSKENDKLKIKIRTSQRLWHKKYTGESYLLVAVDDIFYLVDKNDISTVVDGMGFQEFEETASCLSPNMADIAMWII